MNDPKLEQVDHCYMFWCPGCQCYHVYRIARTGYSGPAWTFNGNLDSPTFSLLLKNTYPDGKVCHLFLTNGMIQYCGDSFHSLAGKTVPLTPMPKD
jgi:hypothetical protein